VRGGRKIIAIVPARSGSKGIPDKNMRTLGGRTLIARAAQVLSDPACAWIDRKLLSTDCERYADEGRRHGLECPFLRPEALSRDDTGAIETLQQVWRQAEEHYAERYDVLLIVEPTCPLRRAEDIVGTVAALRKADAQSAVAVSLLDTKHHPDKLLRLEDGRIRYYASAGAAVKTRQSLSDLYYRNGACYAVTRECLFERNAIFCEETVAFVIDRPLANIDESLDLAFAEFLESRESGG
jgi:CMP-N,N'-diacetyllegionaminic acid synthase